MDSSPPSLTEAQLRALADRFSAEAVVTAGPLTAEILSGGRSNPTFTVTDGDQQWILRRPPYGHVAPRAHDMQREARIISAMGAGPVPVPDVVLSCEDPAVIGAPFFVMGRLDGWTLRGPSDVADLSEAGRTTLSRRVVDTLADLHGLDPTDADLAWLGRGTGYLERQVVRWRRQWDATRAEGRPSVDDALDVLERTLPIQQSVAVVHGDYKLDNVMVERKDPTRIAGILDWEMATIGDPLADLGFLVAHWDRPDVAPHPIAQGTTALPGFPDHDALLEQYVLRTGTDVSAIDWYVAFADFKLAVLLEGIHARHLAGHTSGDDFEGVGAMVDVLLDRVRARTLAGHLTARS